VTGTVTPMKVLKIDARIVEAILYEKSTGGFRCCWNRVSIGLKQGIAINPLMFVMLIERRPAGTPARCIAKYQVPREIMFAGDMAPGVY